MLGNTVHEFKHKISRAQSIVAGEGKNKLILFQKHDISVYDTISGKLVKELHYDEGNLAFCEEDFSIAAGKVHIYKYCSIFY